MSRFDNTVYTEVIVNTANRAVISSEMIRKWREDARRVVDEIDDELATHMEDTTSAHGINLYAKKAQEAWITPTLLNGWVNFDANHPVGYFKDEFGIVHLRGLIKSGVVTSSTILWTFPILYRPLTFLAFPTASNNGTSNLPSSLDLRDDGTFRTSTNVGNTWLALDGISFRA